MSTMQKTVRVRRKKSALEKNNLFDYINILFLVIFSILMIIPFYHCIVLAFSDGSDLTWNGISFFWPRVFSLESFQKVFADDEFFLAARNSVLRTVLGSLLSSLVTAGFAFALSHQELKFRRVFTFMGLICMYFSGGMIPTYLQIRSLGLTNTFWVYILPGMVTPYYVILIKTYMESIPRDMEEAATIDGANLGTIFFKIILPLSKPILATIAVFSMVAEWNYWFDTHIYILNERLYTLQYVLYKYMQQAQKITEQLAKRPGAAQITTLSVRMTITFVVTVPILLVYPFMQRYFTKGLMVGAIKG